MQLDDVASLGGEPTRNRDLRARGRETVAKLLRAGHEVVEERGHDQARVDDIVQRAGLSHGTFYLYFRDRDDLLLSLIRVVARELEPLCDGLRDAPSVDDLATWIQRAVSRFDEHAEVLRAARSLGVDDCVETLVGPVGDWLASDPDVVQPRMAASLLLCHLEKAAVRDDIIDASALASVVLRGAGARVPTEIRV